MWNIVLYELDDSEIGPKHRLPTADSLCIDLCGNITKSISISHAIVIISV